MKNPDDIVERLVIALERIADAQERLARNDEKGFGVATDFMEVVRAMAGLPVRVRVPPTAGEPKDNSLPPCSDCARAESSCEFERLTCTRPEDRHVLTQEQVERQILADEESELAEIDSDHCDCGEPDCPGVTCTCEESNNDGSCNHCYPEEEK